MELFCSVCGLLKSPLKLYGKNCRAYYTHYCQGIGILWLLWENFLSWSNTNALVSGCLEGSTPSVKIYPGEPKEVKHLITGETLTMKLIPKSIVVMPPDLSEEFDLSCLDVSPFEQQSGGLDIKLDCELVHFLQIKFEGTPGNDDDHIRFNT